MMVSTILVKTSNKKVKFTIRHYTIETLCIIHLVKLL